MSAASPASSLPIAIAEPNALASRRVSHTDGFSVEGPRHGLFSWNRNTDPTCVDVLLKRSPGAPTASASYVTTGPPQLRRAPVIGPAASTAPKPSPAWGMLAVLV